MRILLLALGLTATALFAAEPATQPAAPAKMSCCCCAKDAAKEKEAMKCEMMAGKAAPSTQPTEKPSAHEGHHH